MSAYRKHVAALVNPGPKVDHHAIKAVLQKHGYTQVKGGKGSHRKWKKPNCPPICYPSTDGNRYVKRFYAEQIAEILELEDSK